MNIIDKKTIAAILHEIAILLELKGENQFKVRAYINGSRAVDLLDHDIKELVVSGKIKEIKGIGNALAENIKELVKTGDLLYYHELKNSIPTGLLEILRIPGLGPKKANKLYELLGVSSIAELEYACRENRLIDLKGFGYKSQANVLKGIEHIKKFQGQFVYAEALREAYTILFAMNECPDVKEISIAGSLRRAKEIVKDIDLVASAVESQKVMDYFLVLPQVAQVLAQGPTKTSITLKSGINCDLRVVEPAQFPYALHHFTGSKEHNTAMRHRAKGLGIKVNEYGLFKEDELLMVSSEEEFFNVLGLQYIPPELREGMGEIETSEGGNIPELLELKNIQGVFHIHTTYSDGSDNLLQLVEEAKRLGYKYLGISDHSQTAVYARGLKIDDVMRQREEIQEFNFKNPDFYVFHGIESDIHMDGSLDYPEKILELFDFVIASIHSGFSMTEEKATKRLLKAIENPYTTMLGHVTGRILLGRQGYGVDMEEIAKGAQKHNVILELNASPYRLDIDWRYLRLIKEKGIMVSINSDAHRKEELLDTVYGVQMARKGWLEKKDVFNTWPVENVKDYFNSRKEVK